MSGRGCAWSKMSGQRVLARHSPKNRASATALLTFAAEKRPERTQVVLDLVRVGGHWRIHDAQPARTQLPRLYAR
jgi:hypothetical protein